MGTDALLSDDSIDIIDLCVPIHEHAKLSIAALKAGKHVICEKPMARSLKDAEKMLKAADKNGKGLYIAHTRRFDRRWKKIKENVVVQYEMAKEKRRVEEALRESEEKNRNLIENANDAIFTLDLDGAFQLVNKKFEEITGFAREEVLGKKMEELKLIEQGYSETMANDFEKSIGGDPGEPYEIVIINRKGERKYIELSTTAVIEKGEIVGKDYGRIPSIQCYASQLGQVFLNILINAGQAIEGQGTVTVKTFEEDDQLVVEISDDGQGMDEATVKHVFDPFFTTRGVSVSYGIIKRHNGRIYAESEVGKGTTFTIELPLQSKS